MSPKIHSSASQQEACMPEKNWVWHTKSNSVKKQTWKKKEKKAKSQKKTYVLSSFPVEFTGVTLKFINSIPFHWLVSKTSN